MRPADRLHAAINDAARRRWGDAVYTSINSYAPGCWRSNLVLRGPDSPERDELLRRVVRECNVGEGATPVDALMSMLWPGCDLPREVVEAAERTLEGEGLEAPVPALPSTPWRQLYGRVAQLGHRELGLCNVEERELAGVKLLRCTQLDEPGETHWISPASLYDLEEVSETVAQRELAEARTRREEEHRRVEARKQAEAQKRGEVLARRAQCHPIVTVVGGDTVRVMFSSQTVATEARADLRKLFDKLMPTDATGYGSYEFTSVYGAGRSEDGGARFELGYDALGLAPVVDQVIHGLMLDLKFVQVQRGQAEATAEVPS